MNAAIDLQTALYTTLSAAGLTVFDAVPDNYESFPYVTIGEDSLVQWDTKTINGFDASVTIHVWSRESGRKEAKLIQAQIYAALHNKPLTLATDIMHTLQQTDAIVLQDPDGKTRHGIQTFRSLIAGE